MRSSWILVVVSLLGLVACASNPRPVAPGAPGARAEVEQEASAPAGIIASEVPDDFSVDITILAAEDGQSAETRTSRYVLFADGTLRYGAHADRGPNTIPPVVRRLSHHDVDELWNRAQQLGLTDPAKADPISNFRKVWSPWEGHVYLVAFTADGTYWNFTRKVDPGEELDPAIRSFLRNMAALAWAEDLDGVPVAFDPHRYDYGPDPYERYRANKAELNETDGTGEDDR